MSNAATDWVADKLVTKEGLEIVERTPEDFLVAKSKGGDTFLVAVLGVKNIIELSDVEPLFAGAHKPQFVVNIPSKARWSGAAINYVHAASAAFGTLSEVVQASYCHDPGCYREKILIFTSPRLISTHMCPASPTFTRRLLRSNAGLARA